MNILSHLQSFSAKLRKKTLFTNSIIPLLALAGLTNGLSATLPPPTPATGDYSVQPYFSSEFHPKDARWYATPWSPTDPNWRYKMSPQTPLWLTQPATASWATINVNSNTTYQTVLGMGTSLEETSIYALSKNHDEAQTEQALSDLIDPVNGIGMSLFRVCIGTSDFSDGRSVTNDPTHNPHGWYTYQDGGPTAPFSIQHDIDLNIVHTILLAEDVATRTNHPIKIFASAWSPPAWMKDSNSLSGGNLLTSMIPAYATYLRQFVEAYQAQGIPIYAITTGNEHYFSTTGYPSCYFTPQQETTLVQAIATEFANHNITTKVWILDHNYAYYNQVKQTLAGLGANLSKVDSVAYHHYAGDPSNMTTSHNAYPTVGTQFTEGSVWGTSGMNEIVQDFRNWSSSYVSWVTMTTQTPTHIQGPYNAPPALSPTLMIRNNNTVTGTDPNPDYYKTPEYYLYGQFMKFVQPGAVRIASDGGSTTQTTNVAFKNPDGTIVIVAVNQNNWDQDVRFVVDGNQFNAAIPAATVATYVLKGGLAASTVAAVGLPVLPNPISPPTGTGNFVQEWYFNISGVSLTALETNSNYPNKPSGASVLTQISTHDQLNTWPLTGTRMTGCIVPNVTGAYTFYFQADSLGEFRLSTDSTKAHLPTSPTAYCKTYSTDWTSLPGQISNPVNLVAGQKYYFETVQAGGAGNGRSAVAWDIPGIDNGQIISGNFLAPSQEATAPAVTSPLTASATTLLAFNYQIAGSNTPFVYTASGLPAGLTLNASTGVITGTPTTAGTYRATIGVLNVAGQGTATLVITVAANPLPVINSATTASGVVGTAFSYTIAATNTPTSFTATNLPAGLAVNTTTGVISGTPSVAGTFAIGLSATNASGTGTATLNLAVATTSSAASTIDINFSGVADPITAAGAYTGDGLTSPKWNNVTGTTSTLLTSTGATATGVGVSFTSSGTFSSGTTPPLLSQMLLALSSSAQKVTLTGLAPNGNYQLYLYGQNGNYKSRGATFSITTGSGSPAAGSNAATANVANSAFVENVNYVIFNVKATSAGTLGISWTQPVAGGGEGDFNGLQLVPTTVSPAISSAATATATQGSPFSYTITASNSPTGFGATGLPAGLSLDPATGIISGTPTAVGTSSIGLSATNAGGTGTGTLALTVNPPIPAISSSLIATTASLSPFTYTITASNSPTGFNATGLPSGLSVDTATGIITGTPTTAGSYSVTLSATNAGGTGTATLNLTVTPPVPVLTSSNAVTTISNSAFSYTIAADYGATSFNATGLPAGLTIDTTTGVISGTPTVTGVFQVTLSATNAYGTGTETLTLTLNAPPTLLWTGTTSGSWDTTTVNWLNSGTATPYADPDYVNFDDTGSGGTVTLSGSLRPSSVTVTTSSKFYNLYGPGILTGSMALTKSGSSALGLNGANTYTGGTLLLNGQLSLSGNAKALGTGTLTLGSVGDANAVIVRANSINLANAITVNPGGPRLLEPGNGNAVTYTGPITLNGGATVFFSTIGGNITASGGITGTGNILLGENGGSRARSETLSGGAINNIGTISDAGNPDTGGAFISAPIGVNVTGIIQNSTSEAMTLSGNNAYNGPITITAGSLTLSGAGTLGSGAYSGTISNAGSFVYNSSADQTMSGVISGAGTLTDSGTGYLTLSGANTYTGATTINSGAVLLVNQSITSPVNVASGGLLGGSGTITSNVTVNSGGCLSFNVTSGAVAGLSITGNLTLNGTINVTPTLVSGTLAAGTYTIATYTGTLTGTPTFVWTPPNGSTLTATFDTSTAGTIQITVH